MKTLHNTDANGATKKMLKTLYFGETEIPFKLISKASSKSKSWMKSTKAMQAGESVVVQVTTQQRNPDGSYSIAEALTTLKNKKIEELADRSSGQILSRRIVELTKIEKQSEKLGEKFKWKTR